MLNHSNNNIDKDQVDPEVIRREIQLLSKHLEATTKILVISKTLLKYKIKIFDDFELINCSYDKKLLQDNKYIVRCLLFQASSKSLKNEIEYINAIHNERLKKTLPTSNKKPTKENLQFLVEQFYIFDHLISTEYSIWSTNYLLNSSSKILPDNGYYKNTKILRQIFNNSYIKGLYFLSELQYIDYQSYISSNKNSIEVHKRIIEYYQSTIEKLKESIYRASQLLTILKDLDKKKYKGQATYHNLFNGIRKEQSGTILELRNQEKEEERKLLVNLIMNDNYLNEVQKQEAFNNITNEDLDYEIDSWLGKKLTKHERRVLRVLRRIIYQMIEQEEITGVGKSIYEAEIPLSRIYEEYGLEKRERGGYQHKQTKIIQDVLFGFSTRGLHEDILFKHTTIMKTRFILQIEKIKQKVIGIERTTSIRIAMPHFLFVSDKKASSYYYQDTEGFKKFMAIKGMSQNDAAFNIVEYLEWFLSSKLKERSLNQSTLIEEGGIELQKRCKNHKGEVLETIETILNNMVRTGYLVKEWRLEKGKYDQLQYTFKNLRYELLIAGKNKCEVTKLPTKKSTKNRKYINE